MTDPSRRSVLLAPVALAAASIAPPRVNAPYGLRKRLRPYYASQFRDVKWTPIDELGASVRPVSIGGDWQKPHDRLEQNVPVAATDLVVGEFDPTEVVEHHLTHSSELPERVVRVFDPRDFSEGEPHHRANGHQGGVDFFDVMALLGFVRHFLESLVGVATAMVKRAGRVFKSAWPAVLVLALVVLSDVALVSWLSFIAWSALP
jgi:hypothetical protein